MMMMMMMMMTMTSTTRLQQWQHNNHKTITLLQTTMKSPLAISHIYMQWKF